MSNLPPYEGLVTNKLSLSIYLFLIRSLILNDHSMDLSYASSSSSSSIR